MVEFYAGKRANAHSQIAKRGMVMYVRDQAGEEFDEATGEVTEGTNVDHETRGLRFPVKQRRRDSGAFKEMWKVLLSGNGADGQALTVVPDTSMQLVVNDVVYQIAAVDPLSPGGVDVLYEMEVGR